MKVDYVKLAIAIIGSEMAGVIGSMFTSPAVDGWYASLNKPELNPPDWVFGPVWTTLFALMGVAAYLVWQRGTKKRGVRIALGVFVFQLVLNTAWSIIFFGLQSPSGAFVDIILLWLAIAATIVSFARVSTLAAWLLVPYILWVTFAIYLNGAIIQLNS